MFNNIHFNFVLFYALGGFMSNIVACLFFYPNTQDFSKSSHQVFGISHATL